MHAWVGVWRGHERSQTDGSGYQIPCPDPSHRPGKSSGSNNTAVAWQSSLPAPQGQPDWRHLLENTRVVLLQSVMTTVLKVPLSYYRNWDYWDHTSVFGGWFGFFFFFQLTYADLCTLLTWDIELQQDYCIYAACYFTLPTLTYTRM